MTDVPEMKELEVARIEPDEVEDRRLSICTCGWPDYSDCQGGGFPCPANPDGDQ